MKQWLLTGLLLFVVFSSFRDPKAISSDGGLRAGDAVPQILAKDINDQPFKLTDYRGYYVFIDFWASWCDPCRRANPTLVELLTKAQKKKFKKAKGLIVVNVSMDSNPKLWRKAVEKDGIGVFINVCDGKGWDSPILNDFGIRYLPANFMVTPDGEIEAVDLFGPNLEAMVSALR